MLNMPELKLLIVFRKYQDDVDFIKNKAANFFVAHYDNKGICCSVSIGKEKNIDTDSIYKADLHELEVILNYENCDSNFYPGGQLKNIAKDWCDSKKNCLSHLWLRLCDRSVLVNKAKQFHNDVDVKEIAFGTAPTMKHFMQHYHYKTNLWNNEIIGTFLHNHRHFIIFMCMTHADGCYLGQRYKLDIIYKDLVRVLINIDPSKDVMHLYFFTKHLPFVYKEKRIPQNIKNGEVRNEAQFLASDQEYQRRKWERSLEFGCKCNSSYCTIERVGRCPVFKIEIQKSRGFGIVERIIQRCASNTHFFFTNFKKIRIENKLGNFDIFPHNEEFLQSVSDSNKISDIRFICQYAWQVLLGQSSEVKDQIILKHFISRDVANTNHWGIIKYEIQEAVRHTDALVHTLYHISDMIMRHDIFVFEEAFRDLFLHYKHNHPMVELPHGMCLVRCLIIMPSRTICLQPREQFDNRIIREFGSENFLRVSIQDDDFSRLTFAVQNHSPKNKDLFMKFIKNKLIKGIIIGPRKYRVLASSNSQLRGHGLWMFSTDHKGKTTEEIREWMGNFNHIKNIPKYMARMGQCFSTSEKAVQVEIMDEEVIKIEDLENEDCVFSDGIGMISTDIAEEVRELLNWRIPVNVIEEMPTYKPSAFQIRFKGCKGMIVENPNLEGRKLLVHPSMEKFDCENSNMLEIVKISAPRALFLNRPLISLMEQLGIEANVFIELLKDMVFDMTDSLIYERKAYKMLANRTGLDFPFKRLLKSGICLTEEPFFRRLLLSIYTVAIGKLHCKTRIAIPPEFGRNMLGVVDETDTLKYGQVFVQYSEELGNNISRLHTLDGEVVVTTNPCMHPGDIRKFKAVDVPHLRHIKDCIVFPASGARPHPDEMAGSDLDGDEFVVIWSKKLIFKGPNHEAMDYPSNEELCHKGPITVPDMVEFLCKYIQNDSIGTMANAHLAWADYHEEGIYSSVCQSIAKKYPLTLDFAKSGTTKYLSREEKPKIYPDFMEKGSRNNSYKSKRALGLLYRVTRILEACISKMELYNENVSLDCNLVYPGWEEYRECAEKYQCAYVKRIKNILKKFGLHNETEALSGYAGKLNECNENLYERDQALSVTKTYIKDTIKMFRAKFIKLHNSECERNYASSTLRQERKYRRASAWYVVAYTNDDKSVLSFPWVISDIICEIREKKLRSSGQSLVSNSSFINSSDDDLIKIYSSVLTRDRKACYCFLILNSMVHIWVTKNYLILTMQDDENFCRYCFEKIINTFREHKSCCSAGNHGCDCAKSCSPTELLLKFMKFYAIQVVTKIGHCENVAKCNGFRESSLQSLALQTYTTLAITRNCLTILKDNQQSVSGDDTEEGEPVRVPVPSDFEEIITHHLDNFMRKLKVKTGVRNIFIDGDQDVKGNWYILVHSIGKPHQRWALEELMMDNEITTLARSLLKL